MTGRTMDALARATLDLPAALVPPARAPKRETELSVEGLAKRFGAVSVFSGVSFTVRKGEAVALLGANGAGKSTLFRSALRLIEPDAGTVSLFGRDITRASPRELVRGRAEIGFVFQRHNLVPRLSALSNVVHGALGRHGGMRCWAQWTAPVPVRERAMHCLSLVGLADIAGRRCDRLSGGQSQRVAIARALMGGPRLVIADEPVASLDPKAGEEVMALFVDLIRSQGLTLLFTTHHVAHALAYADRVLALYGGRLAIDRPAAALDEADLRHVYE